MTDKVQKIREEVERLKSLIGNNSFLSDYEKGCNDGREDMCDELISFIDSLQEEPVREDLEEEIGKELTNLFGTRYDDDVTIEITAFDYVDIARHFAKWQKEQMMTKSIEAVVSQVPCSNEIILYNPSSVDKYYLPQEMNKLGLNKGDKIKVIVIKED